LVATSSATISRMKSLRAAEGAVSEGISVDDKLNHTTYFLLELVTAGTPFGTPHVIDRRRERFIGSNQSE
jgi:hypothetical protein